MTSTRPDRASLAADAVDILRALPRFGRIMIALGQDGVAHERLGPVAQIDIADGRMTCSGDGVITEIEINALGPVIVDRTVKMKDRVLPKLEMCGHDGTTLFSVHGLDGLAPFDAVLDGYGEVPIAPKLRETSAQAVLQDGDIGLALLETVRASGQVVAVTMAKPGVRQIRTGTIDEIKPVMGFANVIRPDFHLHLRGGLIARWEWQTLSGDEVEVAAVQADETRLGLSLRGPSLAFAS